MNKETLCPICGGTGEVINGREVACACCGAVLYITGNTR